MLCAALVHWEPSLPEEPELTARQVVMRNEFYGIPEPTKTKPYIPPFAEGNHQEVDRQTHVLYIDFTSGIHSAVCGSRAVWCC